MGWALAVTALSGEIGRKGWRDWKLLTGPGAEIQVVRVASFWVGNGVGCGFGHGVGSEVKG